MLYLYLDLWDYKIFDEELGDFVSYMDLKVLCRVVDWGDPNLTFVLIVAYSKPPQ